MPKKGLYGMKDRIHRDFRIYKKVYDAMVAYSKQHDISITELVNYTLAERFCPSAIIDMEEWKKKPRYTFLNRITKNQHSAKNQKQRRSD
jgi:hypothetical protein